MPVPIVYIHNFTILQGNLSYNRILGLTRLELWIQLGLIYIFLTTILICIHIFLIFSIIKNKKLLNRFYIIICALLITRTLFCGQVLSIGLFRILHLFNITYPNLSRLFCHALHFHNYFTPFLEMLLLLILLIDRTLALIAYAYYRRLTPKNALIICILAYMAALILKLIPSYFGVHLQEIIMCVNLNSAPSLLYNKITQNVDFGLAISILIAYLMLMGYLRFYRIPKLKKASKHDNESTAAMVILKRQMRLIPLLRRMVLSHCGLTLLGKTVMALAPFMPPVYAQRLVAYGGILMVLDVLANALVLLGTNETLRRACIRLLKKKSTRVGHDLPRVFTKGDRSSSVAAIAGSVI